MWSFISSVVLLATLNSKVTLHDEIIFVKLGGQIVAQSYQDHLSRNHIT